jgi:hypothetical protein
MASVVQYYGIMYSFYMVMQMKKIGTLLFQCGDVD